MKETDNKVLAILFSVLPYIIIIIAVILLRAFIITPVRVDGSSMKKTLTHGDILLLFKLGSIKRYDVVVLKEVEDKEEIIKRIIALPGETIEIKDNEIYINNEKIEDKYAYGLTSDYSAITLKDDEYFVLGDNRTISKDSRVLGPIKKENIEGKTIFRLFPLNKIGTF